MTDPANLPEIRFLLLPEFSALSLFTSLETLQNFHLHCGAPRYRWTLAGLGDTPVTSSLGAQMQVQAIDAFDRPPDTLVVVAGLNVERHASPQLDALLRKTARQGARLVGLCTAAHALARAGVLNGRAAAIHWNYHPSFAELFDQVSLSASAYHWDAKFGTSAGGIAAIDLFLDLIETDHGADNADAVAELMNYTPVRTLHENLQLRLSARRSVQNSKLQQVLELMETHTEDPLTPNALAEAVGISPRQLERLFQRHLGATPKRYYTDLRLTAARNLLIQTRMSVTEIAIATGFSSTASFAKHYKRKFNSRPKAVRAGHDRP